MLKTKSSTKLIQLRRNLRRKERFPCDPWHHVVKVNEHPKIKCTADIFVVALHNTSSGDVDPIRLFDSIIPDFRFR